MKYPDYFSLEVADYGMTTDEMIKMLDDWMATLRPLYLQLHTWTKYKLAEKYHQPVPKKIPAHWINNRWSAGMDRPGRGGQPRHLFQGPDAGMDHQDGRAILYRAGFLAVARELLDEVGSLSGAARIRNGRKTPTPPAGTSISRTTFVRCKASSRMRDWFFTAHHELGHGYYFMAYAAGSALSAAHRRRARLSRRDRRVDFARLQPGARICNRAGFCRPISRRTRPPFCSTTRSRARFRSFSSPPA